MKKILSFILCLFWLSNMMAVETITYTFTSYDWSATPANWVSGKNGNQFQPQGVYVTTSETGANATSPIAYDNIKKIVITYTSRRNASGTIDVQIGENEKKSLAFTANVSNQTLEFDYDETQSGKVKFTVNVTNNQLYITSIAITYNYSASAPAITAEDMNLGTQVIDVDDASLELDTVILVSTANLTEPVSVAFQGTHLSATENSLPAVGGSLHLHVSADAAMLLSDTVILTANDVTTKVPVIVKVNQNIALPGTVVSMAKGAVCYDATINGRTAIRVGNTSNDGNLTITVPAYANKLRFYAAAWANMSGNITLSAPDGVELSETTLTLKSDAGIANATPFLLDALVPTAYAYEVILTGVTSETVITVSSGTARRFVVWDAKCDIYVPDPEEYTVNYLSQSGSTLNSETVTLTLPIAPTIPGFTFQYWQTVEGNINDGIKIQAVYTADGELPSDMPAVVVNPDNRSQKLIRNGNVYILHDGIQYTVSGARL